MHRRSWLKIAFVIAVASLVGCSGGSPSATGSAERSEQGRGVVFLDPEGGYTITHPAAWEEYFDRNGIPITFVAPLEGEDRFAENLGIVTDRLPNNMSFDRYEEEGLKLYQRHFDVKVLSSKEVEVAGLPAYLDHMMLRIPQGDVEQLQWTVNADGDIYILTFTGEPDAGFDRALPVVEEMLASFEVTA